MAIKRVIRRINSVLKRFRFVSCDANLELRLGGGDKAFPPFLLSCGIEIFPAEKAEIPENLQNKLKRKLHDEVDEKQESI